MYAVSRNVISTSLEYLRKHLNAPVKITSAKYFEH